MNTVHQFWNLGETMLAQRELTFRVFLIAFLIVAYDTHYSTQDIVTWYEPIHNALGYVLNLPVAIVLIMYVLISISCQLDELLSEL